MDITLVIIGLLFMLIGLIGSLVPVLPGPPLSWIGFLFLHFTTAINLSWWFLGITLLVTIAITILDYVVPAVGAKKFGGSKYGVWGTSIGLVIGIFAPVPFAIILFPFLGAFIGEMIKQSDSKVALRAAFGSFIGFLAGTFIKFMVSLVFFGFFIARIWENRDLLF